MSAVTPAPSTWLHRTSPTSTTSHEPPASSVRMPPSTAGVTTATAQPRPSASAAPIASAPAGSPRCSRRATAASRTGRAARWPELAPLPARLLRAASPAEARTPPTARRRPRRIAAELQLRQRVERVGDRLQTTDASVANILGQRRARRAPATTCALHSPLWPSQPRKLRPRRSMLAACSHSRRCARRRVCRRAGRSSSVLTVRALPPSRPRSDPQTDEWITTPSGLSTLTSRLAAARCPTRARRSRFTTPAGCRWRPNLSRGRRRLFKLGGPVIQGWNEGVATMRIKGGGSDPRIWATATRARAPSRRARRCSSMRAARRQIRRRRADRALPRRADQRGGGQLALPSSRT